MVKSSQSTACRPSSAMWPPSLPPFSVFFPSLLIQATSHACGLTPAHRYQSFLWRTLPPEQLSPRHQTGHLPCSLQEGVLQGNSTFSSEIGRPRLAARCSLIPALLLGSSANLQILSGAWGGDRGTSISNLIPHAWRKEPVLSQQTRCLLY